MLNILNAIRPIATNVFYQQTRNTFILRRYYPMPLSKKNGMSRKLRHRNHIFKLVQDTDTSTHDKINVILTEYAEKFGDIGDIVPMKRYFAYKHFLLPGLAIYDTPENREKYKTIDESKKTKFSSPNVHAMIRTLNNTILYIKMSPKNPWVIEPWHVRLAFNCCSIIIPDDAIELPENEIKGPDMSLENKEFYVVVTINNQEKVNVRCRIHHCDFNRTTKPIPEDFANLELEPLFPEQAEVLKLFSESNKRQL